MERLVKRVWNKIFKEKGESFTRIQEDIPKIAKLFKKNKVKRVRDLGCGAGRHTVYLAKLGFDVYGIDISDEGIKITRKRLKKQGLKAHLKIGNIHKKLPYKDDFFDAIISVRVLNHGKIKDIRRTIKEIKRILKPDGLIFITVRKELPKKYIPREKLYGIKYIAPRTYIILGGEEKGLIHYKFNKEILRKEFKDFKTTIWVDSRSYYCLLGTLKT